MDVVEKLSVIWCKTWTLILMEKTLSRLYRNDLTGLGWRQPKRYVTVQGCLGWVERHSKCDLRIITIGKRYLYMVIPKSLDQFTPSRLMLWVTPQSLANILWELCFPFSRDFIPHLLYRYIEVLKSTYRGLKDCSHDEPLFAFFSL